MVRSYIVTDRERDIINFYLEHEKQLNGFRELKYFINQLDIDRLEEDLRLVKKFLGIDYDIMITSYLPKEVVLKERYKELNEGIKNIIEEVTHTTPEIFVDENFPIIIFKFQDNQIKLTPIDFRPIENLAWGVEIKISQKDEIIRKLADFIPKIGAKLVEKNKTS